WNAMFYEAEGGIRGRTMTGVQTCALPISHDLHDLFNVLPVTRQDIEQVVKIVGATQGWKVANSTEGRMELTNVIREHTMSIELRSEERRVGKTARTGRKGDRRRAPTPSTT